MNVNLLVSKPKSILDPPLIRGSRSCARQFYPCQVVVPALVPSVVFSMHFIPKIRQKKWSVGSQQSTVSDGLCVVVLVVLGGPKVGSGPGSQGLGSSIISFKQLNHSRPSMPLQGQPAGEVPLVYTT